MAARSRLESSYLNLPQSQWLDHTKEKRGIVAYLNRGTAKNPHSQTNTTHAKDVSVSAINPVSVNQKLAVFDITNNS